jgi:hypothetical protein
VKEMLKRRIFLSIGILTNILFIYVAFALSFPDVFTIESFLVFILSLVSFFGVYLLFYLGISLITGKEPGDNILFPAAFSTLNFKKINYFDLEDFYISVEIGKYLPSSGKLHSNKITIWKQENFYLRKIDSFRTDSRSIDSIKSDLKKSIDNFKEKESENNSFKSSVKNWKGDVDKSTKRDYLISKILNI